MLDAKLQAVSSLCVGKLKRPSNKIHIFTCLLKDVEVGGGDKDDGEGSEDEEVERVAVLVECVLCHLCFSNLSIGWLGKVWLLNTPEGVLVFSLVLVLVFRQGR